MPYTMDQVYLPENLIFCTQSPGRKPTLYFRTNHGSGRLRQEHPSGPLIKNIVKHYTHAFFPTKAELDNFVKALHALGKPKLSRAEYRRLRSAHGGFHRPTEGYFHREQWFHGHEPSSLTVNGHTSMGQVVGPAVLAELRKQVNDIYKGMKADPLVKYG